MPQLILDPQYSSSWIQRTIDRLGLRQGTLEVPLLEAQNGETVHLDASLPYDTDCPAPIKHPKLRHQQSSESRLLQIPQEIMIHFMRFMPHSSLYMVRQTCQILRELTNDIEFKDFHWKVLHFATETHRIIGSTCDQLRLIERIFLRRSLCEPCRNLLDTGELEWRLRRLWQPIHCGRCNQNHPRLIFPQGNEKGNICVGLLGHFDLCKHVKVSVKLQPNHNEEIHVRCRDPEHCVASVQVDEEFPNVTRYQPSIRTSYSEGIHAIDYTRAFPMVKIDQRQFPGMSALQANLLKQLKEGVVEELCLHAPTQIDAIISCMVSDKCNCFPASGMPVHKLEATYGRNGGCPNNSYQCRYCLAHYFWLYEGDYIVLELVMFSRNTGPDSFGWLSNLTFDTDEHPIFNDNTKSVLWCDDPSCGTGCGKRWLLMLEILKRTSVHRHGGYRQVPPRDKYSALRLPFTLEYQVFQGAAAWPVEPDMLSLDLMFPIAT